MTHLDVNCDMGEDSARLDQDLALLRYITSANIACGGHAGDAATMRALVTAAKSAGRAIGAHPSYPDRANFGRAAVSMPLADLEQAIAEQIAALGSIAREQGAEITHVKPHGALYHAAMHDADLAAAIARAAAVWNPAIILVGQAGAPALAQWQHMGFRAAAEAFADRRYDPDGRLQPRSKPAALITDPVEAAGQALDISRGYILAADDSPHSLKAETLCIHSDTPQSLDIARAVHEALTAAGITLQPLA
jgi:5-oxoprolinase (ATP-hydrolysing) subunit A